MLRFSLTDYTQLVVGKLHAMGRLDWPFHLSFKSDESANNAPWYFRNLKRRFACHRDFHKSVYVSENSDFGDKCEIAKSRTLTAARSGGLVSSPLLPLGGQNIVLDYFFHKIFL